MLITRLCRVSRLIAFATVAALREAAIIIFAALLAPCRSLRMSHDDISASLRRLPAAIRYSAPYDITLFAYDASVFDIATSLTLPILRHYACRHYAMILLFMIIDTLLIVFAITPCWLMMLLIYGYYCHYFDTLRHCH